ncbi:DNA topoisomerase III [Paenibacillus albiflavus]|uniref:DNA topoisomerase n=1 Tax=Paenibacillus albiflavus TaxID=2545760 RepID=A0A4R4EB89_9BACL|nr:DNA topoisomerase III [Paenibacillus albiflavus]TCZ75155.1 DNA topoisomerase III [Paenibacillus albiflavus]
MKSLVLCEKPSVAKEIARVLGCKEKHKSYIEGPAYIVTWALGHLVELSEPEDYDPKYKTWKLEDLPLLPSTMKLKIMRETSHQYKAIAQLCKRNDLKELIVATDAGREGELVARWIMEMVHWRKPFRRLWISSQTDKAIRDGFAHLRPGKDYDNLYASAVCRAEADWLIGLNVTRALTCKYDAQLSAGRVQTPTLATMMEREREIEKFRPVPFWTVTANLDGFQARWRGGDSQDGRLFAKDQADAIVSKVKGSSAKLIKQTTTEKIEPQPLAYDLTELQRDANNRLGFSAKQTSNVLQKLYEQHKLVTYPRTDSRYLTSDMAATFSSRLESVAVGPYAVLARPLLRKPLPITKRIVDDSKVTDHHAIIPTEQFVDLSALSSDERRLYDLIVKRFIALFYPVYRYDETSLTLESGGEKFYAKGRVQKDAGWKEVYGNTFDLTDDEETDHDDRSSSRQLLPDLKEGQQLIIRNCQAREQATKPPSRYNEASLLSQMEKHNLGTPATRADIIEKLIHSETIERHGKSLIPTGKGKQLIELVASELRSPELTAEWERELERIARGAGNRAKFISGIREQAEKLVREVKVSDIVYKPHNLTHSRCPECNQQLMERNSKRGKLLVCSNRECNYKRNAEPQRINKRCPVCHKKMELHTGKAGKYAQCRLCNIVEKLEEQSGSKRVNKHQQAKLIKQYSDNTSLTSGLGDALRDALNKMK